MRILIAEDDQVLADGLLRSLRASGAAVDHVASGNEADAALMANNEFDLLILDLGLPKMHGLDVLKKLRGRGSSLPVLILTAADGVEERVKGLDYGADDYMAKPFSLQELEAHVRALTRRGMGGTTSTIKHGPLEQFQRARRSLFGESLDWMLRPLLLLWPVSLVLTWLVAQSIAGRAFDRALEYTVQALAQLVTVQNQRVVFNLPQPARELLR